MNLHKIIPNIFQKTIKGSILKAVMDRLKQSEEKGNNPIKIVITYLKNSSKNEFTQNNSCLFQKTIKGSILKTGMVQLIDSTEKSKPKEIPQVRNYSIIDSFIIVSISKNLIPEFIQKNFLISLQKTVKGSKSCKVIFLPHFFRNVKKGVFPHTICQRKVVSEKSKAFEQTTTEKPAMRTTLSFLHPINNYDLSEYLSKKCRHFLCPSVSLSLSKMTQTVSMSVCLHQTPSRC